MTYITSLYVKLYCSFPLFLHLSNQNVINVVIYRADLAHLICLPVSEEVDRAIHSFLDDCPATRILSLIAPHLHQLVGVLWLHQVHTAVSVTVLQSLQTILPGTLTKKKLTRSPLVYFNKMILHYTILILYLYLYDTYYILKEVVSFYIESLLPVAGRSHSWNMTLCWTEILFGLKRNSGAKLK